MNTFAGKSNEEESINLNEVYLQCNYLPFKYMTVLRCFFSHVRELLKKKLSSTKSAKKCWPGCVLNAYSLSQLKGPRIKFGPVKCVCGRFVHILLVLC